MDHPQIKHYQERLLDMKKSYEECMLKMSKDPNDEALQKKVVHLKDNLILINKEQKKLLKTLLSEQKDQLPPSLLDSPHTSGSSDTSQSGSNILRAANSSSSSSSNYSVYEPEDTLASIRQRYSFLDEDNLYLLDEYKPHSSSSNDNNTGTNSISSLLTPSYSPSNSSSNNSCDVEDHSSHHNGIAQEYNVSDLSESSDLRDLATQEEFFRVFGMLPMNHLTQVLKAKAHKNTTKRQALFFAPSPAERRDAKRKKKSYMSAPTVVSGSITATPLVEATIGTDLTEAPSVMVEGFKSTLQSSDHLGTTPIVCDKCLLPGDAASAVLQCGGCGSHTHASCTQLSPHRLPCQSGIVCPSDPWLCVDCDGRGIRVPVLHDTLLLRNIRLSAAASKSKHRTANKKSEAKKKKVKKTVERKPVAVKPQVLAPAPLVVASPNMIKTRSRANRRPPAKLLSSSELSRAQPTQRQLSQLNLATKSIKILHSSQQVSNSLYRNSSAGSLVNSNGSSSNSSATVITLSTYSTNGQDVVRTNKSARINVTRVRASSDSLNASASSASDRNASTSRSAYVVSSNGGSQMNNRYSLKRSGSGSSGGDGGLMKVFKRILSASRQPS